MFICFIYTNTNLFQSNRNKKKVAPGISQFAVQQDADTEICYWRLITGGICRGAAVSHKAASHELNSVTLMNLAEQPVEFLQAVQ